MLYNKFLEVLNTPYLWNGNLLGLNQLQLPTIDVKQYPSHLHPSNLRLGKQIESFVEYQLAHTPSVNILKKTSKSFIKNKR